MAITTKKFNGKIYKAYQEYTNKPAAKKGQAAAWKMGYLARLSYSKWAMMWILYVRKK